MSKLKKNFLYQSAYEILVLALPLLTAPYISRALGPSNVGIYSYTHTIANYFVIFGMLGLKNYGNRKISQVRDNPDALSHTFSNVFALHFAWSLLVLAGFFVYTEISSYENKKYLLICSFYVLGSAFDINWFFFGIEKFKVTVFRNICVRLVTLVCIFTLVKTESDLWRYITLMAVGSWKMPRTPWKKEMTTPDTA